MAEPTDDPRAETDGPVPDPQAEADGESYDEGALGAVEAEEEGAPVAPSDADGDGTRAADDGPGGPEPEPDPIAVLTEERDRYLDQLQRARADYDNLNKRRHKEVAEARERGQAALAESLLEVLDNFGFALKAAEESEDANLAKGVQLVHGQLLSVLRQAGLEEVPGVGASFDPEHHEALVSEADEAERAEPEVAEVMRTGYRFGSRLLRPAAVRVLE